MKRRSLAYAFALACATLIAGTAVGATPLHAASEKDTAATKAATPRVIYFDPAPTTVTSSNGTTLTLTITVRYLTADTDGHVNVELATPGATGNGNTAGSPGDDHMWSFTIRGKQPVTLEKSGKATGDFGTKTLGRFGYAHFVFTPKANPEVLTDCDGTHASQSTYRGSLKGSFAFDTGTGKHGWGVVKGTAKALGLNHHASVIAVSGAQVCNPQPANACPRTVTWDGDTFFGGTYDDDGSSVGFVAGTRVVNFKAPKKAQRIDVVTRQTPVPTLATSNGTTTLTITTDGQGASGSATMTASDSGSQFQAACGASNASYTTRLWLFATLTNGAQPLHVTADVFPSFTASDSTNADFSQSFGPA